MGLKRFYLVASVMLLALMASCNQDAVESVDDSFFGSATRANGKPLEIDYSALDTYYFVTDKDVESYIHFKKLLAEGEKREFEVREVVPLGLNDKATLAYLLNYNDGWEIIAADKRAPLVLVSSETGNFGIKDAPTNTMAWIESLEADVLFLRTFVDRPKWADDETWKNMLLSNDFWLSINADNEYIARNMSNTRMVDPDLPLDPPIGGNDSIPFPFLGHWELYSSQTNSEELSNTGHLTSTAWHQEEPYNNYMPYRTDYPGMHAFAGCSAVACAQMLYYLNTHYGYPVYVPESVVCTGNVSNEHFTEVGASSTKWSMMFENGGYYMIPASAAKDSAAVLIASCGNRLGLNYMNDGGHLNDLDRIRDDLMSSYGVSCTKSAYSTALVDASLLRHTPVIATAYFNDVTLFGLHLYYEGGHVFLIDGYKRSRTVTTNTYIYVYDTSLPHPDEPIYDVSITYSSPYVSAYTMNWGEPLGNLPDYVPLPIIWYSGTGSWIDYYGDDYLYDRTIFTDFSNNN